MLFQQPTKKHILKPKTIWCTTQGNNARVFKDSKANFAAASDYAGASIRGRGVGEKVEDIKNICDVWSRRKVSSDGYQNHYTRWTSVRVRDYHNSDKKTLLVAAPYNVVKVGFTDLHVCPSGKKLSMCTTYNK